MRLAIQTSRLPGDSLDEKFANARRYGFDGVEVSIGPSFDLAERFADVRSASTSSGVPVSAICTHSIHDPLMPDNHEREERTWIVVSGYIGDRIFYRKAMLACGGQVWHHLAFEYPAIQKRAFDLFVTRASYALQAYGQVGCRQ